LINSKGKFGKFKERRLCYAGTMAAKTGAATKTVADAKTACCALEI
jgi:hypothetical protein